MLFRSEENNYQEETRINIKPSLWSRIKNSRFVRSLGYIFKIKITLQMPEALPEGNSTSKQ